MELKDLPPEVVAQLKRGLATLLSLNERKENITTDTVLYAVEECPNKALATAILFSAVEWAERNSQAPVWAKTFDWMRHVLGRNDVYQLPELAWAVRELEKGQISKAVDDATTAGGFDSEFVEIMEYWNNYHSA